MKQFSLAATILLSVLSISARAQWSQNAGANTPVCTSTGNQREQRLLKDGNGGAFIVWKDYRTGVPDIYMQRFNAAGVPLWTANGIGVCTQSADQSTPNIVSDEKGGVIVVWSDWRSGIERDIYAQRADSNGNMLWTADGVVVTNKTNREHTPKMISDDAGGAIIVWEQQSGAGWDIYAQRLNSNGSTLWTSGGIPVCSVAGNRINAKIEKDGKGGAIVVWQDERSGTYDIYAQRISPAGALKWSTGGKLICNAANVQVDPKVDPDSSIGGAYFVWIDKRNGNYDLYAQRVDSSGNEKWTSNGIAVAAANGKQTAHDLMSNNKTNGLFVTWKDNRSGNYDVYAQKISPTGTPQWTTNGVVICNNSKDQLNPNITSDNNGGAIIVWQDSSGNGYDIKAQRVNANGSVQWTINGVLVSNAAGDQTDAKNIPDGNGGTIIAFTDKRPGTTTDIYAHHLFAHGSPNSVNEDRGFSDLNCYPNPFINGFRLTVAAHESSQILVTGYDLIGRKVEALTPVSASRQAGTTTFHFDTRCSTIADGMYMLQLSDGNTVRMVRVQKRAF